MFIPGFSGGMWGSSILQVKGQKESALRMDGRDGDMLSRLSENMRNVRERRAELKDRMDRYLAGLDGAAEAGGSALNQLSDDHLKFYFEYFRMLARFSEIEESGLLEYRDRLAAFDQTIQQYQEMLEGTAALPEQMTMERVQTLLDAAKSARDTFLREGAEELNRYTGKELVESTEGRRVAQEILGPSGYEDKSADFWRVDPDAADIYGEIDRVLTATRGLTQHYRRGVSVVAAELERRGYADAPYRAHLDRADARGEGARRDGGSGGLWVLADGTFREAERLLTAGQLRRFGEEIRRGKESLTPLEERSQP